MSAIYKITMSLLVLCLGLIAQADVVVLDDDFSTNKGWSPAKDPAAISFANGSYTAIGSTSNGYYSTTSFSLGAAASYQVNTQITLTRQDAEELDRWPGVRLIAPWGDEIAIQIQPKVKNVSISHKFKGEWNTIMKWKYVDAIKSELGATNDLVIDSQAGRFTLFINGESAGTSTVVNFTPSSLAFPGDKAATVIYDNLKVVETGIDSHQARLLLLAKVPGQQLLAYDNFKRQSKSKKLLGKLISKDDDSGDTPDWGDMWNDEDSRAELDSKRERLILQSKNKDAGFSIELDSEQPITLAGVTVNAKLDLVNLGGDNDCAGVKINSTVEGTLLKGCITRSKAKMVFHSETKKQWTVLSVGDLARVDPASADIRLVYIAGDVVMFVDGKMMGASHIDDYFYYFDSGVELDGNQTIEVKEFMASEI